MFYAIYFFKLKKDIDKIKISYVYVEHDNAENSIILERKYLDNYIKELMAWVDAAENDTEFVKNKSKLCPYCDFEEYCEKH